MSLVAQTALKLIDDLRAGTVTSVQVMDAYLDAISEKEPLIRAFITVRDREELLAESAGIDERRAAGGPVGPLEGLPIAIKDSLCTEGLRTTCASRMLAEFVPPYDATVVERIRQADGIILGKTNMDEFSMGSSTENSAFHITRNPRNTDYVPGGTSGGSAAAIAAGEAAIALGADTGGSVRQPAAFCGVVGLKPTYGRVSRYGLIAYASSLDQVGVCARSVDDAFLMLSVIAGHDARDSTSLSSPVPAFPLREPVGVRKLRIGIPEEYLTGGLDPEVRAVVDDAAARFREAGHDTAAIRLPRSPYSLPAYYVIACAEASSNLSRYDGCQYGHRSSDADDIVEMTINTRSEAFGDEVKRRIMLGTYALSSGYLDQFYNKACRVRRLISDDFVTAFQSCDVLLHPIATTTAFRIGEKSTDPLAMYLSDVYSVTANLTGLPAATVPCTAGASGLPIGLQLVARWEDESTLWTAARILESLYSLTD